MIYYVLPHEEPPPFEYSRRQVLDGVGVLAFVAVALVIVSTLLLGAWGW